MPLTPMNTVQTAFSSPRFNRYLLWFGVVVLAAGAIALVVAFAGGGSDKTNVSPTPGFHPKLPTKSSPLKNQQGAPIKTYGQLDSQIRSTISKFIGTAVARQHVGDSWAIVSPSLRSGYTYKQWRTGDNVPVVPYPGVDTKHINYYLDEASNKQILVEVGLSGKPGVSTRPTTFEVGLVPVGKGANAHWLVDYWMPRWTPPVPQS
jgi:hypothetical protein